MAFRSSAKASSSSGGTITATPAGVAAHDYLGAIYSADTISATLTKPAGWNTRATNNWGSGSPDGHTSFYADKDDASGTDGFGFSDSSGSGSCSLITAAWSGRDNAAPRSTAVVTTVNTSNTFSPISATINGITASAGDDVAVLMNTDQAAGADRWTFSTITSYTEQQDGVATDWVSGIALDTRDNVSGGATGNFSTTITNAGSASGAGYGGFVVAIKAAAAAADQPPQAECGDCWEASAIGEAEIHDAGPWDWYQDETCPNRAGVEPPIPERLPESFEWVDPNETDEALYQWPWGQGPPPADVDTYVYDGTIHDSSTQLEDVDQDFAFFDAPSLATVAPDQIWPEDASAQLEDADEDFGFADAPRAADVVVATDFIAPELGNDQPDEDEFVEGFRDDPLPDDILDQLFNEFGHFDDPTDEPVDEGWFAAPMDVAAQADDSSVAQECPQPLDEDDEPCGFEAQPLAEDVQSDQVFAESGDWWPDDVVQDPDGFACDPTVPELVIEEPLPFCDFPALAEEPEDEDFAFSDLQTPDDVVEPPAPVIGSTDGAAKHPRRRKPLRYHAEDDDQPIAAAAPPVATEAVATPAPRLPDQPEEAPAPATARPLPPPEPLFIDEPLVVLDHEAMARAERELAELLAEAAEEEEAAMRAAELLLLG